MIQTIECVDYVLITDASSISEVGKLRLEAVKLPFISERQDQCVLFLTHDLNAACRACDCFRRNFFS